ncbi:MAG: hypothetical protein LBO74_18110 [Candidatus Symbiothrix sp.]|jgi:type III restriction enzyme|nr:hypothetical protein [Candidatus Symbiothrix sp.]
MFENTQSHYYNGRAHKFKGDAFLSYFEGFNNYFLRFGATFPKASNDHRIIPLSNVAYTLDSISAFRQNLVKKIVVYTQDVAQNSQTLVSIADNKSTVNVNSLVNGIIRKETLRKGSSFNGQLITKINKDNIALSNGEIVKMDYHLSDEALRQMIRTTIKIHFEKEQNLFNKGIKALTLFFMESDVSMFRGDNPKIKKIFEEEYNEIITNYKLRITDEKYLKYLENDYDETGTLQVHKGYFSGDKGTKEEQVQLGVDEILKDKKKLLSFESSTRFIFSIWALQEGWDNPNVFTICKLSNQGSEISKLQQIGRGLRICVNQNLKRNTISKFAGNEEDFWAVNNLDVVVSDKEVGFVEEIQKEILDNSFFVTDTFTEVDLKKVLKEKTSFDDATVRRLFKRLDDQQMIIFKETIEGQDVFEKSSNYSMILKEQTDLPPEQYKALENLFADVKNYVQNANNRRTKKNLKIKDACVKEFETLWHTINKNAFYMIENLDENAQTQLIIKIAEEIAEIKIDEILLQTMRRELNIRKLEEDDAIVETLHTKSSYSSKLNYLEFVQQLASQSHTPLRFVINIFNALPNEFKTKMIANNPAQALKEMAEIINKHLLGNIKARIKYETIEGKMASNDMLRENKILYLKAGSSGKYQEDITNTYFSQKEKWIFEDVIEYDSEFEKEIILFDPKIDNIEIFGKLPRLKIKTPLGEYNPDFCYAVKGANNNKLFLVVESKGYNTLSDIPPKERGKIDFAKKYFEKLNEQNKDKNISIRFVERINKTQLASLIQEITPNE